MRSCFLIFKDYQIAVVVLVFVEIVYNNKTLDKITGYKNIICEKLLNKTIL